MKQHVDALYVSFSFHFFYKFVLDYICFIMVYQFHLYSKVNQPYMYPPFFWISFPFRSPQSTEYCSLSYTGGSYQLCILALHLYLLLKRGTHTWRHLWLSPEGSVPSSVNTSLLPHLGSTLASQPLFSDQHPTALTQQLIRPCHCKTLLTSQPEWKLLLTDAST